MREIRKALPTDLAEIMMVMEAAKKIMRSSGNIHQWTGGYPSEAVILSDIEKDGGYVMVEGDRLIAYFAFLPSPEPTYNKIYEGSWVDDEQPYHVVHRIASYPDVHHVFRDIMDFCFAADRNIRVDTHRDNHIMQHIIVKYGFTYCGIIYLASQNAPDQKSPATRRTIERLAYQKLND